MIRQATQLSGADNGFIYQLDGDSLRTSAGFGPQAEEMTRALRSIPAQHRGRGSATARAFSEGRTFHIPDVLADPEYTQWDLQRAGGFRAILAVPLRRDAGAIGVLALWRTTPAPFTDAQMRLVELFADQAVVAIENARLISEIQEKSRQVEIADRHKSEFLANMSHELRERRPALVLMDINLPGIDGVTALARIREDAAAAAIPIFAVTASVMKEERERLVRAGFDGFITKPFDVDLLPGVVRDAIANGRS